VLHGALALERIAALPEVDIRDGRHRRRRRPASRRWPRRAPARSILLANKEALVMSGRC
jgi:hypothetical protein